MSGWQVGDLALCVRRGGNPGIPRVLSKKPVIGGVYMLEGVVVVGGVTGLVLQDHYSTHSTSAWRADCFIRITPPEADEFDREVIEHLTGAPVKEKA